MQILAIETPVPRHSAPATGQDMVYSAATKP